MVTPRRLWMWTLVGLLLPPMSLVLVQSLFFQRALKAQHGWAARMIETAMGHVATHALRSRDDLLLQQVIQGLSKAPGITLACVQDPEGRILAHTLPGKLGLPFKRTPEWTSRPLSSDGITRGMLSLWFSQKHSSQWESLQVRTLGALLLLQIFGAFSVVWLWRRALLKEQEFRSQFQKATNHAQEEVLREQGRIQNLHEKYNGWLMSALEQTDRPLLLLDEHQRVVAFNPAARRGLDPQGIAPVRRGQHLLDIAMISLHLPALEESLKNPGHLLQLTQLPGAPRIQFLTVRTDPGNNLHTWVYLPSS